MDMRISVDVSFNVVILGYVTNMENSDNTSFIFLCTSALLIHQINKNELMLNVCSSLPVQSL